jgi:hypothetical protein
MNRNYSKALLALALLVLAVPVTWAVVSVPVDERAAESAQQPAAANAKSLIGELAERDLTAKTFAVKSEETVQRFILATDAKVMAQGRIVQLADLKVGAKLEVTYTGSGATLTATRIEVLG